MDEATELDVLITTNSTETTIFSDEEVNIQENPVLVNPILWAQLPDSDEWLQFEEHLVKPDGDCGYSILGNREAVSEQLLLYANDNQALEYLADDIVNAFVTYMTSDHEEDAESHGALEPYSMESWEILYKEYLQADSNNQEEIANVQKKLKNYCMQPEMYEYYAKALKGELWMSCKVAMLYARAVDITLYIWIKSTEYENKLELKEFYVSEEKASNEIHIVYTDGFTHFNFLSKRSLENHNNFNMESEPEIENLIYSITCSTNTQSLNTQSFATDTSTTTTTSTTTIAPISISMSISGNKTQTSQIRKSQVVGIEKYIENANEFLVLCKKITPMTSEKIETLRYRHVQQSCEKFQQFCCNITEKMDLLHLYAQVKSLFADARLSKEDSEKLMLAVGKAQNALRNLAKNKEKILGYISFKDRGHEKIFFQALFSELQKCTINMVESKKMLMLIPDEQIDKIACALTLYCNALFDGVSENGIVALAKEVSIKFENYLSNQNFFLMFDCFFLDSILACKGSSHYFWADGENIELKSGLTINSEEHFKQWKLALDNKRDSKNEEDEKILENCGSDEFKWQFIEFISNVETALSKLNVLITGLKYRVRKSNSLPGLRDLQNQIDKDIVSYQTSREELEEYADLHYLDDPEARGSFRQYIKDKYYSNSNVEVEKIQVKARGLDLNNANLMYADLSNCDFYGSTFEGATVSYADFRGSKVNKSLQFKNAETTGTIFDQKIEKSHSSMMNRGSRLIKTKESKEEKIKKMKGFVKELINGDRKKSLDEFLFQFEQGQYGALEETEGDNEMDSELLEAIKEFKQGMPEYCQAYLDETVEQLKVAIREITNPESQEKIVCKSIKEMQSNLERWSPLGDFKNCIINLSGIDIQPYKFDKFCFKQVKLDFNIANSNSYMSNMSQLIFQQKLDYMVSDLNDAIKKSSNITYKTKLICDFIADWGKKFEDLAFFNSELAECKINLESLALDSMNFSDVSFKHVIVSVKQLVKMQSITKIVDVDQDLINEAVVQKFKKAKEELIDVISGSEALILHIDACKHFDQFACEGKKPNIDEIAQQMDENTFKLCVLLALKSKVINILEDQDPLSIVNMYKIDIETYVKNHIEVAKKDLGRVLEERQYDLSSDLAVFESYLKLVAIYTQIAETSKYIGDAKENLCDFGEKQGKEISALLEKVRELRKQGVENKVEVMDEICQKMINIFMSNLYRITEEEPDAFENATNRLHNIVNVALQDGSEKVTLDLRENTGLTSSASKEVINTNETDEFEETKKRSLTELPLREAANRVMVEETNQSHLNAGVEKSLKTQMSTSLSGCQLTAELVGKLDVTILATPQVIITVKQFNELFTAEQRFKRLNLFNQAIKIGNFKEVKIWFEAGIDVNAKDEAGRTPLAYAVFYEQLEIVKFLLSKNADPYTRSGMSETTHIDTIYAKENYIDSPNLQSILSELSKAGLKPNLHQLISIGDMSAEKMINLPETKINMSDERGDTPLHLAARFGRTEIAALLLEKSLEKHIDITILVDKQGKLALEIACLHDQVEIAGLILNASKKVDVEKLSILLHRAAEKGFIRLANLLVRHGAKVDLESAILLKRYDDILPYIQTTPSILHLAIKLSAVEVATWLLEQEKINLDQLDDSGRYCIEYAFDKKFANFFKKILQNWNDEKVASIINNCKFDFLLTCVEKENWVITKLLLEKDVKPSGQCLKYCCDNEVVVVLKILWPNLFKQHSSKEAINQIKMIFTSSSSNVYGYASERTFFGARAPSMLLQRQNSQRLPIVSIVEQDSQNLQKDQSQYKQNSPK